MSDFGDGRYVVPRKAHQCQWCGEDIPAGEKHWHFKGRWQDEWQNWRMHVECYETASEDRYILVDGFTPHEFQRGSTEPR